MAGLRRGHHRVERLRRFDRCTDPCPIASVDCGRERGGDRQPELRPLAEEALEVVSRNAPGLHVRKRPHCGSPFIQQQAEVAEGGWRGDRCDRSVAFIHPNAHLHRAVGEQV